MVNTLTTQPVGSKLDKNDGNKNDTKSATSCPDEIIKINNDIYVAGNITHEQASATVTSIPNVKTVIQIRKSSESNFRDYGDAVRSLGAAYHHIPTAASDFTYDHISQLLKCVKDSDKPVLITCASARRAAVAGLTYAYTIEKSVTPALPSVEDLRRRAASVRWDSASTPALEQFVLDFLPRFNF